MHRHLRVEDGLVQSQVNAILESSSGFVWLGTFGGVSRWDGTRFDNFQVQDGLAGLDVRAFHETKTGDILVSTADGGICRYHDGTFTTIGPDQGLPSSSTRGFHLDEAGHLFVATSKGLYVFNDESLDPTTARHLLPDVRISGFADRRAGGFYLSTYSDGVLVWNGTGAEPLLPAGGLPGRIIRAVHEMPDGSVLISIYHHGVWVWRDGAMFPFDHNDRLAGHDVMAFTEADDGTLYMPTIEGGIAVCRGNECEFLTTTNGLANNTSWAVHEGADGTIYLGTWDGVNIYHPGRITTLNPATGLRGEIVTAIAELADGTVAVATFGGGVSFFDGHEVTGHLDTGNGLEHDRVWSLLTVRDGSLYIGTNAGLDRWRDGKLTTVYHEGEDPSGRIYAMCQAGDGAIWLGTYGGVRVLRDGRPEPVYEESDAHRSTVYSVAETPNGDLLFGTAAGLVVIREGKVVLPEDDSPLARLHIWKVYAGRDGPVYLGTNGEGLWTVLPGPDSGYLAEKILDTDTGLSDNVVFGIAEDDEGLLYLTTQRGVSIVTMADPKPTIRQLHSTDGLAGEECNQGACCRDSRGRLWFGTIRGVTCYDPAQDLPVTRPPRVHWRGVRLFTDDLPLSRFRTTPVFTYRDNFFRFDFVAANPRAPHKVGYRHRLSGIDRDWVEGRETSVAYTSLPPASYTFSVMARNEWGYWSDPENLTFRITPPFWKTWWFILLAVLAGAGSVALIVLGRVRHLLAYEQLRTRIAADLHDDIGAGLTEISIISRILEQKLPEEPRTLVENELRQMGDASRGLIRSMSDIVWLIHPQRDSLRDLVTRLADSRQNLLRGTETDFRVEGLDSLAEVRLDMEQRQHLYLLFKEAVNNAIKYSGCRKLLLSVAVKGGRITMSLRDDGAGFDTTAASGGNGLRNMLERAAKIGGDLEITSAPGEGCLISFTGR